MKTRIPRAALRTVLCLASIAAHVPDAGAQPLWGAGATMPGPVYDAWAVAYVRAGHEDVRFARIGSGLGIALIEQRQVDFGASDAPLSDAQLSAWHLIQIPVVIAAVVPVINIGGIAHDELVLNARLLSAIYRGRIRNWRDPEIAALNPLLHLPDANITVVHRADASGTTLLWSRYLADGDDAWKAEVGSGMTLAWPTGSEGLGNEGVASLVQRTRASIGYVGYAYARQHGLSTVAIPSHDGPVVHASEGAFEAAVASASWHNDADLRQSLIDEPGSQSWPIIGVSFVLMPQVTGRETVDADVADRARRTRAFLDWALTNGRSIANTLGYVAMPDDAIRLVRHAWSESASAPSAVGSH